MAASGAYIAATPLSFAQKLVQVRLPLALSLSSRTDLADVLHRRPQARMVSQGVTVAALIASAGLSQIPNAQSGKSDDQIKREEREDGMYAWKKGSPHTRSDAKST